MSREDAIDRCVREDRAERIAINVSPALARAIGRAQPRDMAGRAR
jgi:hypothetical protein